MTATRQDQIVISMTPQEAEQLKIRTMDALARLAELKRQRGVESAVTAQDNRVPSVAFYSRQDRRRCGPGADRILAMLRADHDAAWAKVPLSSRTIILQGAVDPRLTVGNRPHRGDKRGTISGGPCDFDIRPLRHDVEALRREFAYALADMWAKRYYDQLLSRVKAMRSHLYPSAFLRTFLELLDATELHQVVLMKPSSDPFPCRCREAFRRAWGLAEAAY